MSPFRQRDGIANRILLALSPETLRRIRPSLELVDITRGQSIDREDRSIDHLYFVNSGLISMVKTMRDGRTVEIGAVGIEGITDPYSLFGLDWAVIETFVQIPGTALRVKRDSLRREMERDGGLRELVQKYAGFTLGQFAQTAACNRLHPLEARLCRWLLIAHDSVPSDAFPLTHEYLAMMLGVQRAGVSIAMSFLKKAGLIQYERGHVNVLNRPGLDDAACECYGTARAQLGKLFGRIGKS